jgi:hypothetical protein
VWAVTTAAGPISRTATRGRGRAGMEAPLGEGRGQTSHVIKLSSAARRPSGRALISRGADVDSHAA